MGLNLVRGATAGVLGAASGALESQPGVALGTTTIRYSTIVESVGLVAGAGLQLAAPMMAANLADGLVDGGLALLLRRGAAFAMAQMRTGAWATPNQATRVNPQLVAGSSYRGQVGVSSRVPKRTLT